MSHLPTPPRLSASTLRRSLLLGSAALLAAPVFIRDARAQTRLAEVVAALEVIRLDLLRLRAGAGSVESITADLTRAREMGDHTDRLLAAGAEVDAFVGHDETSSTSLAGRTSRR